MPSGIGGSYQSLGGTADVYRSTTVAGLGDRHGVLDTVKKAFNFGSSKEELLEKNNVVIMPR